MWTARKTLLGHVGVQVQEDLNPIFVKNGTTRLSSCMRRDHPTGLVVMGAFGVIDTEVVHEAVVSERPDARRERTPGCALN